MTHIKRINELNEIACNDSQCWDLINLLLDSIDHAYMQTNGKYGDLALEVVDKVEYLKKLRSQRGIKENFNNGRNPNTTEYKGFEYKEEKVFNPVEFGWSKKEIDDFYNKKNDILNKLNDLNLVQRGHRVVVYDDEIAVYDTDVPMLADCREIARETNCESKHERTFDCFLFYL